MTPHNPNLLLVSNFVLDCVFSSWGSLVSLLSMFCFMFILHWLNSALSPVVYGDIALSINT